MSKLSKYSLQDLESEFVEDFSQHILSCMLCDYSGSNITFEDQQNYLSHVFSEHTVEKILSNGVIEYHQNGFLIGSHSDKCILKNCNTRILENKNKKLGVNLKPEDLCLRVRLPSSTIVSLFETLEEEDILKGIYLCLPHLQGKKKVFEIFVKYGIAGYFTPNFTTPKPIKSGNIPILSSNFKKRILVQKVVCSSLPYDALQMDFFILSKEKEEIESELKSTKLSIVNQSDKPKIEINNTSELNEIESSKADLFIMSNLVTDLETELTLVKSDSKKLKLIHLNFEKEKSQFAILKSEFEKEKEAFLVQKNKFFIKKRKFKKLKLSYSNKKAKK